MQFAHITNEAKSFYNNGGLAVDFHKQVWQKIRSPTKWSTCARKSEQVSDCANPLQQRELCGWACLHSFPRPEVWKVTFSSKKECQDVRCEIKEQQSLKKFRYYFPSWSKPDSNRFEFIMFRKRWIEKKMRKSISSVNIQSHRRHGFWRDMMSKSKPKEESKGKEIYRVLARESGTVVRWALWMRSCMAHMPLASETKVKVWSAEGGGKRRKTNCKTNTSWPLLQKRMCVCCAGWKRKNDVIIERDPAA